MIWLVLTLRKAALVNRLKMDLNGENLVLSERGIILLSVAYSVCQLQNGGLGHLAEDCGGTNANGLATSVI